jgi:hypothetical protein
MLRINQLLIAGLAAIVTPGIQAECFLPADVVIPDGTLSTYEEMNDSQVFVKEYMVEMETYLECLAQETSADPDNLIDIEEESLQLQRRHSAIDSMELVAAKFNEQVRAYKKANP